MFIDMKQEHKQRYGYLYRLKRMEKGLTQQEVVDQITLLSLRSYVQLENGKPLLDPDIYDALGGFYNLPYNYESDLDEEIERRATSFLACYIRYDTVGMIDEGTSILTYLQPYICYAYEHRVYECIRILILIVKQERSLNQEEYQFCRDTYPILPQPMQSLFASFLYQYEYQMPHRDRELHALFHNLTPLYQPDHIRNAITYCLHQINKDDNYLAAYEMLVPYEKMMLETENWHGLFDVYHWMILILSHIQPTRCEPYLQKALELSRSHPIQPARLRTFYHNLSGVYYQRKDYPQASSYMKLFLLENCQHLLPALIWYVYYERLQNHAYPQWTKDLPVKDCSDRLRILWKYFLMRMDQVPYVTCEQYLIHVCLPVLKHLAVEFHHVYLLELKDLITRTRNYKNLYLYMEQLQL